MKKLTILMLCVGLIGLFACKRSAVILDDEHKPAAFHYIVEGSANPSMLFVSGDGYTRDTCTIVVKVTDNMGVPVPGRTIYLEQFHLADFELGLLSRVYYGFFDGVTTAYTTAKVTNAAGRIQATYWGPLNIGSQYGVIIRAMMADDDHTYTNDPSQPYDFIHITFFDGRDQ